MVWHHSLGALSGSRFQNLWKATTICAGGSRARLD